MPGLAAKPIIDIALEVPDSTDEPAYVSDLEAAGYVLRFREPEWFEHRFFHTPDGTVHVHVFSAGCPETDRMVRFRDWLRTDDADRELYLRTKRELAAPRLEVHAAVRRRQDRSGRRDHGPGYGALRASRRSRRSV